MEERSVKKLSNRQWERRERMEEEVDGIETKKVGSSAALSKSVGLSVLLTLLQLPAYHTRMAFPSSSSSSAPPPSPPPPLSPESLLV